MAKSRVTSVMAGLQIIRYVTTLLERFEKGEMTAEELQAAWDAMGVDWAEANRLWEQAGGTPT